MPDKATNKKVTWKSSNTKVAAVYNGIVTAVGEGTATITVTTVDGNKSATCKVTVSKLANAVTFGTVKNTSLAVGKTLTFKAKAFRTDGAKPASTAVTYEIIYGADRATVDAKGKLKGISTGEVVVRATAVSGTADAYEDIVINVCIPATKVKLDLTKASMIVGGEELQLYAQMTPSNNTDTLVWSSANEAVATVDENGVVTAHKPGKVKITAASGSGKTASCTVTVGAPADAVTFGTVKSTSLAVGKTLTLKAKAFCVDGVKPVSTEVKYEIVSGSAHATVDAKGKLKGTSTGKVVVRATAVSGTADAFAEITINVCVPITKIKFSTSKITLSVGDEVELQTPVITPFNHTDTVEFYSSNENVAFVDENGTVTALSKGTAKIYAKSGSGKTASYTVKVQS